MSYFFTCIKKKNSSIDLEKKICFVQSPEKNNKETTTSLEIQWDIKITGVGSLNKKEGKSAD